MKKRDSTKQQNDKNVYRSISGNTIYVFALEQICTQIKEMGNDDERGSDSRNASSTVDAII